MNRPQIELVLRESGVLQDSINAVIEGDNWNLNFHDGSSESIKRSDCKIPNRPGIDPGPDGCVVLTFAAQKWGFVAVRVPKDADPEVQALLTEKAALREAQKALSAKLKSMKEARKAKSGKVVVTKVTPTPPTQGVMPSLSAREAAHAKRK